MNINVVSMFPEAVATGVTRAAAANVMKASAVASTCFTASSLNTLQILGVLAGH